MSLIGANIGSCVVEMLMETNVQIIAFQPHNDVIDKASTSISAYKQEQSGGKITKTRCGYLFALVLLIICSELRVLSGGVHRCAAAVVGL